jgi:flagellar protein FliO/FliZ
MGLAWVLLLLWTAGAWGQGVPTRQSVKVPAETSVEMGLIHRNKQTVSAEKTPAAAPQPTQISLTRMLLSLGVVVAVILALRWGGVKLFNGSSAIKGSRAMQVVSRSIISPKQQLMLVQVGRRLVVVGNSGTHLATLAEITDADEVAELLGQVQRDKSETIGKTFGTLMRRAGMDFAREGGETREMGDRGEMQETDGGRERQEAMVRAGRLMEEENVEPVGRPPEELVGLLEKVRGMSQQFKRS